MIDAALAGAGCVLDGIDLAEDRDVILRRSHSRKIACYDKDMAETAIHEDFGLAHGFGAIGHV